MLQNLQKFANSYFQKFQLDNLVDFEKCCKTRIFLQRSVPIQPKTSEILPKICQNLATTLRVHYPGAGVGLGVGASGQHDAHSPVHETFQEGEGKDPGFRDG